MSEPTADEATSEPPSREVSPLDAGFTLVDVSDATPRPEGGEQDAEPGREETSAEASAATLDLDALTEALESVRNDREKARLLREAITLLAATGDSGSAGDDAAVGDAPSPVQERLLALLDKVGQPTDAPHAEQAGTAPETPSASAASSGRAEPNPRARPWWERFPDRYARELDELRAAGYVVEHLHTRPTIGRGMFDTLPAEESTNPNAPQVLRLHLRPDGGSDRDVLVVDYSEAHPWLQPAVYAPRREDLRRHREPIHGKLCLVPEDSAPGAAWDPQTTVAQLLSAQMPLLLQAQDADLPLEQARTLEHQVGNSLLEMLSPVLQHALLIDGSWQPGENAPAGLMSISMAGKPGNVFGVARALGLSDGRVLEASTLPLADTRQMSTRIIPWVRLHDLRASQILQEPTLLWDRAHMMLGFAFTHPDPLQQMIALVVRDETGPRTFSDRWLLLERWRSDRRRRWKTAVRTTAAAGPDELFGRVPSAAPLRTAQVVLVGAGAIGGRIAFDLAQAGLGTLTLIDGDRTDPATSARQLMDPVVEAGCDKVDALAYALAQQSPYTRVRVVDRHVGWPGMHERLLRDLAGADVLIDAAASWPTTRYLAAQAADSGTPLIVASATGGAWGGSVVRLPARSGACWSCLEHARHEGLMDVPPALPGDEYAPAGCASPTFTGAAFDLSQVATQAVRVALDVLAVRQARQQGLAEPAVMRGDVHTLALREPDGTPIPARWTSQDLQVHPACPQPHRVALPGPRRHTAPPAADRHGAPAPAGARGDEAEQKAEATG